MRTCEAKGCKRKHYGRGYCKMHHHRMVAHGDVRAHVPSIHDWDAKYTVDEITGCWNWKGSLTQKGYGASSRHPAHKRMWIRANGPVPAGLELDHLCRNRRCVNPEHLETVTHAVNVRRGAMTRLSWIDVCNIRKLIADGLTQALVAKMYLMTKHGINHIVHRRAWRTAS